MKKLFIGGLILALGIALSLLARLEIRLPSSPIRDAVHTAGPGVEAAAAPAPSGTFAGPSGFPPPQAYRRNPVGTVLLFFHEKPQLSSVDGGGQTPALFQPRARMLPRRLALPRPAPLARRMPLLVQFPPLRC